MADPAPAGAPGDAPLREHAFDGIQEYDNDLPRWWLNLFYLTIVASVLYIGHFHFGPGRLGAADLKAGMDRLAEQRAAAAGGVLGEEQLKLLAASADRIAKGAEQYQKMGCATCHGGDASGGSGPNLRDDRWIYGNRLAQIMDVIAAGRIAQGMPGQRDRMPADDIANLAIWIYDQAKHQPKAGKAVNPEREPALPFPY